MSLITHPNPRELTKSVRATVLVFKDPRSQELLSRIERLAPSEANTLIIGETGTGKELVARHIHHLSRRGREPFVAVNCGAFAETLVESELFGHEKGAFTGATSNKAGWFEAAKLVNECVEKTFAEADETAKKGPGGKLHVTYDIARQFPGYGEQAGATSTAFAERIIHHMGK